MARNITARLNQLNTRRQGLDRLGRLSQDSKIEILAKGLIKESYQNLTPEKPYTTYALGSMQEVDSDYTRIGIEEAKRVGRQLQTGLAATGTSVDFRLQGSVPCNIHIRGVSDVDLLVLDDRFVTYDSQGSLSQAGYYSNPVPYTALSALQELRRNAEAILQTKYPTEDVDTSGSKAIKISGGSLRRPIDVVPSHWHDTADYQVSEQEHDRGIYVLDKIARQRLLNMPFRHIKLIGDRDFIAAQGLKKSIRLCKHVKADAGEEGAAIDLSSFDIASAMWHADMAALRVGAIHELAILVETQRHLDVLARNHDYARTLLVPDGSRAIFDTTAKLMALNRLSIEIDDLALEVAQELDLQLRLARPSWQQIAEILRHAQIPHC